MARPVREFGTRDLGGRLERGVAEPFVVDAQGKRVGLHQPPFHGERARAVLQAGDAAAAGKEMAHVVVGVEADQVGAQHAVHELRAPGQHAERLVVREGDVQKEAHLRLGHRRPHERRQKHQVVVLDPHHVARARDRDHGIAEPLVHADISLPRLLVEVRVLGKAVEKRPQRGVREALVIQRRVVLFQMYRHAGALGQRRVHAHRHGRVALPGVFRPSDPEVSRPLVQRPQGGGQPAGAACHGDLARLVDVHAVGQPVRDDDLAAGRRAARQGLSLRGRARAASGCRTFGRGPFACRRSAHGSTFARFARPPL